MPARCFDPVTPLGGRIAGFVLALCMGVPLAVAQDQSPRDRLIDLAMIDVTHELCSFDLSDAQESAMASERNSMLEDGSITQKDIADVHDELAAAMARQVPEGLCRPGGPGETLYTRRLAELGSP